jgi:tetratricopeptide (TPR) repeat protein
LLEDTGAASTDELAWAFRKLMEAAARERPLLLVFEDVQWAEDVLLDLIEHVAFVSSAAPILLTCMSRPELLERRPGWSGVLRLDPLTSEEAERLARERYSGRDIDPDVARRVAVASGGNPLFVEEMTAMMRESGEPLVAVPPTIQALLAARLDQLDVAERTVLEAASVEGEVFHRGALDALAPDEPQLTALLTVLVRKDLVRPDRAELEGEDAFRFRHQLLRDASYESIPKAARARLHERFADWLDRRPGMDAFVGYHLEQAYRYRVEVRDSGLDTDALAQLASERLERAANSALDRSDYSGALSLLERASSLPPVPLARRALLLSDLAAALMDNGELTILEGILTKAEASASAAGDEAARSRVRVERHFFEIFGAAPGAIEGAQDVIEEVISSLEKARDERGLCRAWQLSAWSDWLQGRVSPAGAAWEQALAHARRSNAQHRQAAILRWVASSAWLGAMPAATGIARCEEIRQEVRGSPASEAEVMRPLAALHGFCGQFDLARSLFAASNTGFRELGLELKYVLSHPEALFEILVGNFVAAERRLRKGYELLGRMGEHSLRSTTAALLARALLGQGQMAEADWFTRESEELADPSDLVTHIIWRGVRARLLAADGKVAEAEMLAREAVRRAEQTDLVNLHADALLDLASVLDADGRSAETSPIVARALGLYEEKGNVVAAKYTRARLDTLVAR